MLKNIELYVNTRKDKALILSSKLREYLSLCGYTLSYNKNIKPDLVIGLGGDGTLLHWLNNNNYNTDTKYIGVNCGTLGFLQDFEVTDIKEFVNNIPNYIEQHLKFIKLEVIQDNKKYSFFALNDFKISSDNCKALRSQVKINNETLENFIGTSLIFSGPTGSTANNLSAGGSIICPELETIQMTPSEATVNSEIRSLSKSICFPKEYIINLEPITSDEIKIISDGNTVFVGNYSQINISYSDKYITKLTDTKNNFIKKIREKLI